MFFIGQNLKHVHITNSYYLLLIKSGTISLFGVYFSHIKETLNIDTNSRETNCRRDRNRFTFSLASDIGFEKCRVKILYQQLLIFLSFMNTLFESN